MHYLTNPATFLILVMTEDDLPTYSSLNSSSGDSGAERVLSLREEYGCTEVPYSTSDHSFSLPLRGRGVRGWWRDLAGLKTKKKQMGNLVPSSCLYN